MAQTRSSKMPKKAKEPRELRELREPKEPIKVDFTTAQTAFVLAWLDHCIEQGRHRSFTKTVIPMMEERWNQTFTWHAIYNKLRRTYSQFRPSAIRRATHGDSRRAILVQGTNCLDLGPDTKLKNALQNAKSQVQKSQVQKSQVQKSQVRKSQVQMSQVRKIQARKTQARKTQARKTQVRNSVERSDYHRKLRSHSTANDASFRQDEIIRLETPKSLDRRDESLHRHKANHLFEAAINLQRPTSPDFFTPSEGTVVADPDTIVDAVEGAYNDLHEEIREDYHESNIALSTSSATFVSACPAPSHVTTPEHASQKIIITDDMYAAQASMIGNLSIKLLQLTTTIVSLQNELDAAQNEKQEVEDFWRHQHVAGGNEEDLLMKLIECERLNRHLTERLDSQTKSKRFADSTAYERYAPSLEQIKSLFENIFYRSEMIFQFEYDLILDLCFPDTLPATPGTKELLDRLFYEPSGNKIGIKLSAKQSHKWSLQYIARAFTSAALLSWIFEEDWPDFDEGRSLLLKAYREGIALEDGLQKLQAHDGSAFYRLSQTKAFTSYLSEKAATVAKNLLECLDEICSLCLQKPDVEKSLDMIQQQKDSIEALMKSALELKTNMLLSQDHFSLVVVDPGAAFDASLMLHEPPVGERPSEVIQPSCRVKLCLSPGLRSRGSRLHVVQEGQNEAAEWEEAVICARMSQQHAADVDDLRSVICRPVVLLENNG